MYWRVSKEKFQELNADNRIWWGKDGSAIPQIKRFLSEVKQGVVPQTMWFYGDVGHTQDAKKELVSVMSFSDSESVFITPKPTRLIERILQIATNPGDLVLDSFAGSGTTGHAVLKINLPRPTRSRAVSYLLRWSRTLRATSPPSACAALRKATRTRKASKVEGLGGGFRYCELGEPLFDENGKIRETVSFADLARHVYFTETGEPLPRERVTKSPFIGACRGVGIYLLYNGILGDKSANGGNVLTRAVLAQLPPFDGQKVIYCAGCLLGRDRLQRGAHHRAADALRDQSVITSNASTTTRRYGGATSISGNCAAGSVPNRRCPRRFSIISIGWRRNASAAKRGASRPIPCETIRPVESLIVTIRGRKVMIDSDLAGVYGVETRSLNQAVKRNAERFQRILFSG